MSTYPTAFDATFPGFPYVDNTEYVDQSQANAWVAAIQAIQSTIGYGANGTPQSPLYSAQYATTYSTVTARMAALETTVADGIQINTSAANIQPIGPAAVAGNSGLAADARHVHPGQSGSSLLQIGTIFMWPGQASTFPAGCLLCNGQLVSTSTYSTLFGIVGYAYGGGGASFALPSYNDRFPIGINSTAPAVGSTGGSRVISTNNLPAHNHPVSDPGHFHTIPEPSPAAYMIGLQGTTGVWAAPANGAQFGASGLGISLDLGPFTAGTTTGVTTVNTGSGANYDQPFIGTYFLVRAL